MPYIDVFETVPNKCISVVIKWFGICQDIW